MINRLRFAPNPSAKNMVGNWLAVAARNSDLVLVALCVVVIALMVLPMPLPLLDALIAANIMFAIGLLLYSLYMSSPVSFSTFPSLLLITTLLRISINVATTRQILLKGVGGDIIATFGKLVVGGSLAVGLVVFIIITVVQFIVIAKGAERVAEVIARFTLDAIPGKQMSIDSDMRSGLITDEEAKRRRGEVEAESRFYGAMDGAMKFVKGDAIAGIVIILVNLLGGLAIGILVHHLDASTALQRYSVLSIGEGLTAQIPALFIALAAGIFVTRSSSDDQQPLARSISIQIASQPRAIVLTGCVVSLFCLVPGFPKLTFLMLGGVVVAFGTYMVVRSRAVNGHSPGMAAMARDGSATRNPVIDDAVPPSFATLLIEIAPASVDLLSREGLESGLLRLRRELNLGLGLPFPGVRIRTNANLKPEQYVISVLEVPATQGGFRPDCVLAFSDEATLRAKGFEFFAEPPTFVGANAYWIGISQQSALRSAGIAIWSMTDLMVYHLESTVRLYPHRLLGIQDTQALVHACGKEYPDLVREALKVIALPRLTKLLKGLISEGISLRNMRDILQVALERAANETNDEVVIEHLRFALRSGITFRFARGGQGFDAIVIDPGTEDMIRKSTVLTGDGVVAALPPATVRAFVDAVKSNLMQYTRAASRDQLPILAAADVRRPLRKMLELEMPWLAVISHAELDSGVMVAPVAVIHIGDLPLVSSSV